MASNQLLLATPRFGHPEWLRHKKSLQSVRNKNRAIGPIPEEASLPVAHWNVLGNEWPRPGALLDDYWVAKAIMLLPAHERGERYRREFFRDGKIRPSRIPCGEPVVEMSEGRVWFLVYMGYYVLCGNLAHRMPWTIAELPASATTDSTLQTGILPFVHSLGPQALFLTDEEELQGRLNLVHETPACPLFLRLSLSAGIEILGIEYPEDDCPSDDDILYMRGKRHGQK